MTDTTLAAFEADVADLRREAERRGDGVQVLGFNLAVQVARQYLEYVGADGPLGPGDMSRAADAMRGYLNYWILEMELDRDDLEPGDSQAAMARYVARRETYLREYVIRSDNERRNRG